jgi:class 3 adenylate cyclase
MPGNLGHNDAVIPGEPDRASVLPLARPFPIEAQRLLVRIAAALCLTSGTGGMLVGGLVGDDLCHARGHILASAVAQAMGLGFLMASFSWERLTRWFAPVIYLGLPGSVVLVALAQFTAGPRFVTASIVYVELTALAFYLLPKRFAFGFIGVVGLAHGIVLLADGEYTTPAAQWLYLMGVLVAVGLTFGALLTQGVDESTQLSRLRRFLAPQVADALLAKGDDDVLEPHRRQIAVLFCDLRGFTRFAAGHDPEDVVQVLDEYYAAAGRRLRDATATVGAFAGDGLMAYFNDPVPCDDPAGRALHVAREIQDDMKELAVKWARRGFSLGHGIGIAFGYATLGVIGFEGRSDYTALGPVVNLASRLSDAADHGEILVDVRAYEAANADCATEDRKLELAGLAEPVHVFVVGASAPAAG